MNKRDLVLLLAILLVGMLCWLGFAAFQRGTLPTQVLAYRQGALEFSVPLGEEGTYSLEGPAGEENVLCVTEGKVYMLSANCPDKLCVAQGAIDDTSGSIVCLPHKLVVQLSDMPQDDDAPDTVAR